MQEFDFKNPDYNAVILERANRLTRLRNNPDQLSGLKQFYKENPVQFITDWGMTFDPMRAKAGQSPSIPFIPFRKQVEWLEWTLSLIDDKQSGMTEKSRECGVSWLAIALSVTMCLFNDGVSVGFGSRKELLVDKLGDMDSLLEKARFFIENLPIEFRGGWNRKDHGNFCSLSFPETNSFIKGEAGDNIGRGGRNSWYFVDEAAFNMHQELINASLSNTTFCRFDISSIKGMNDFGIRRHSGNLPVFTFHWREDPRKDEDWYEQKKTLLSPVIVAQEIDINYQASMEGIVIPSDWVQSAIDAHVKLGIDITGMPQASLDVADEGGDLNALTIRRGILLESATKWSGVGSHIYNTVVKAFGICDDYSCRSMLYDADGMGVGVRGDAEIINLDRIGSQKVDVIAFKGSSGVLQPDKKIVDKYTNKDYYANLKAQSWWHLRKLFENTHKAVNGYANVDMDNIISISSEISNLSEIIMELSQPTYSKNNAGKMLIDKKPDGAKSPNLADSIMINYAPIVTNMIEFSEELINALGMEY